MGSTPWNRNGSLDHLNYLSANTRRWSVQSPDIFPSGFQIVLNLWSLWFTREWVHIINTEPKLVDDFILLRLYPIPSIRFKFNATWRNIFINIALPQTQNLIQKLIRYHHHLWQNVSVQPKKHHFDAPKEKKKEDSIDLKQITISNCSLDIHLLSTFTHEKTKFTYYVPRHCFINSK